MAYDFDRMIDRIGTGSAKWDRYGADVLPMWVADMDFESPEPVISALHARVAHGVFGYSFSAPELREVFCERMDRLYNWAVTPEQIVLLPGVVSGFNAACRAVGAPGDGVLMQTPAYPPFLNTPSSHGMIAETTELLPVEHGHTLHYEIDLDAFEAVITERTRMFLFCHPHNPTGCEFSRDQLDRMAEICLRHNLIICSDEIHCELMLDGTEHMPTACVSPQVADRCITLMAPSKTFNIAGLGCAMAIIQNPELRQRFESASMGIVPHANLLGLTAALAAYQGGDAWLRDLLEYLTDNRNLLADYVCSQLPGIRTTFPQATYLGWLDFRRTGIESPYEFCLQQAKVACNDGKTFGPGGDGFVRLNFGCPRSRLIQALEQIKFALVDLRSTV